MSLMSATLYDADSILDDEVFLGILQEKGIEKAKLINKFMDRAKQCGVKTQFERTLKAFEREYNENLKELQKEPEKVKETYTAQFSDVKFDVPLRTGSWQASDTGIYAVTDNGIVCACPHPIYPEQILVNAETGNHKIKLMYKVRGTWHDALVEKSSIASNNKILMLADKGVQVTSENARPLVKYLAEVEALNGDIITEIKSTSRLGWLGEDVFMPYEDNVQFDNEQALHALFESVKTVGDAEEWRTMAKTIRQEGKFEVLLYLASSLASVLVEPCGALPFIVDLWGDTGKGKTVALMFATSVWANPSEGAYMADAKATSTALEIKLNTLNSLPMCLDDMAQIKQQCDGDFTEYIYRWCSGKGRERSNINLGLNQMTHWANATLTNSEFSLVTETMQGGAINRIIDCPLESEQLFDDGNYVATVCRNNYGDCGQKFIQHVQSIGWEKVRELQKAWLEKLKNHAKETNQPKEEKQLLPMSLILTADQLAEECYFHDSVRLPFEKCFDILKGYDDISENVRALEFIKSEVARNISKFIRADTHFYGVECWGRIDGCKYTIIGSVFSEMLKRANVQEKAFLSWADKKNILEKDTKGKTKKLVRFNGAPTRCAVIYVMDEEEMVEAEETPFDC